MADSLRNTNNNGKNAQQQALNNNNHISAADDDGLITNKRNASNNNNEVDTDGDNMRECYENLIVIDTGANLMNKKFQRDHDSMMQRAKEAGVQKIMVPGTSVRASKEALRLTRIYPGTIYSTAGIHPHDSRSLVDDPDSWPEFERIAGEPECVAIGPCGFDMQRDFCAPAEAQRTAFERQLRLAAKLAKPVLVHERAAQDVVLDVLDGVQNLPPVVVRGFMGTSDEAERYLQRGFYLSFNGFLCKDKSDSGVRKLLEDGRMPLDRLLVETDAPFMYPNTYASKLPAHVKNGISRRSIKFLERYCTFQRNEPCSLPAIVEMIAAFMQKTPDEVALATAFNALKLFGLSQ